MAQVKANGIDIEFESLGRADDPARKAVAQGVVSTRQLRINAADQHVSLPQRVTLHFNRWFYVPISTRNRGRCRCPNLCRALLK